MKRYTILLYTILFTGMLLSAQAQNVGISAVSFTPDPQAMLDIQSTVAGLLVPRMTDVQRTAISPTAGSDYGLLVYQTNTVSTANAAGYWYWDGSAWTRLFNGASNGWSLTGNAGTTPGTHFIGTTDNQDWLIYTNNTQRVAVRRTGEVGINTAATASRQLSIANSANNGYGIYSEATGTIGSTYAVYGLNSGVGGVLSVLSPCGVYGSKTGNTPAGNGTGVKGSATGASTINYGGYFSSSGATTNNYGVKSEVSGTTDVNYAVYGSNIATGIVRQYGVYGETTGNIGTGEGVAIRGDAIGTASTNYGGRFRAGNGTTANYGGYFTVDGTAGAADYAIFALIPDDNTHGITASISALSANVTGADYFMSFDVGGGTGSIGSITGTGTAGQIAYNTFTGSHYTIIDDRDGLEQNVLLEATGEKFDTLQGQLIKAKICTTRKSKAVYGVWGGTNGKGKDMVLSIGTGYIWVANKGQDIEVGDYLMSSDVKGCAEKQDDDLYHNYTAARAQEAVTWKNGEKKRMIACIYLGG